MTGKREPLPRFTHDDRLAVRNHHPVEVLVGRHVKLTKKGESYLGLCPFHNEKTPSFKVYGRQGTFHCFGCGAHGDIVGFVMQIQHESYPKAMRRLLDEAGLESDSEACKRAAEQRREFEAKLAAEQAVRDAEQDAAARRLWQATEDPEELVEAYFASRGLTLPVRAFRHVLRLHPGLKYWVEDDDVDGGYRLIGIFPAIVALIQDCRTGRPIGVHCTYLNADGTKLSVFDPVTGEELDARKVRGKRDGGAIRLMRPNGAYLGIAEGWETSLSVLQSSLGFADGHPLRRLPVWSAVSLGNLGGGAKPDRNAPMHPDPIRAARGQRLPSTIPDPRKPGVMPPAGVTHPVLLEDGDSADLASATRDGTRAINRWRDAGCTPLRLMARLGCDFNDLIQGVE